MSHSVESFTGHRHLLFGVAYRILGSAVDAEDVVQEAWLRWSKVDDSAVTDPKAFLITTVSRLAIDRLRQLKARRETYIGPWLPDPISTDGFERAELADSVELAVLVVMETLSPLERAVFVLREAFELPFADIAGIIGREEAATRQLAKRAREHVRTRRPRFEVDRHHRREMTERFLAASVRGDLDALTELFAKDVELVSDGGGKAKAPRRVLVGALRVGRFLAPLGEERNVLSFMRSIGAPPPKKVDMAIGEVNGAPALVMRADGQVVTVVSLIVVNGEIQSIYLMANPDKLPHVQTTVT